MAEPGESGAYDLDKPDGTGGESMALKDFHPPLKELLADRWSLYATQCMRSLKQGDEVTVVLVEHPPTGEPIPVSVEKFALTNAATRAPYVTQFAETSGMPPALVDAALMRLYGRIVLAMLKTKPTTPSEPYYVEDAQGLWLVRPDERGEQRLQLTNFGAKIVADIVEDDGTGTTNRFFEIEASQGESTGTIRVPAKDLQLMHWIAETLGPKARVLPGPYQKEHAHAAMQDLSLAIERRHTYTHTGWRLIDNIWVYLHGAGAITAAGLRNDLSVALGEKLARYRLPAPPQGPDRIAALQKSLHLRTAGPNQRMTLMVPCAYLAPLRELLQDEPPDFTMWVVGKTGHFKSEYAALVLSHVGDFTRTTLPATFESTGNGLERLLHTPKDSLVVIDDYFPATTRREADAMAQVAARLLRGMGNQAARQRMRRDTTMQNDLSPRCMALATAERLPEGHSNSARMFLVSIPPMSPQELRVIGDQLSPHQENTGLYSQAMAAYLQWLATQWSRLSRELRPRFHTLRAQAQQTGCHAREPAQVAYLQLAWETFSQCAVDAGALSPEDRAALLQDTWRRLLEASEEHAALLTRENTVERFLGYLRAGLASKKIYVRDTTDGKPPDASRWGWTEKVSWDGGAKEYIPTQEPERALLIGYIDTDYIYLIPKTTQQYLHQAAKEEEKSWPVDATTLLRELDSAGVIKTKKETNGRLRREVGKKVNGVTQRFIWIYRSCLLSEEDEQQKEPGQDADEDDIAF
jgi:hypothetical protein